MRFRVEMKCHIRSVYIINMDAISWRKRQRACPVNFCINYYANGLYMHTACCVCMACEHRGSTARKKWCFRTSQSLAYHCRWRNFYFELSQTQLPIRLGTS